jgi:hypothetical protein
MQKQISVDEKFLIAAQVLSKQDGLSTVELMLSGREEPLAKKYLWLNADKPKEVLFENVTVDKAGKQKVKIAGSKKSVGLKINE